MPIVWVPFLSSPRQKPSGRCRCRILRKIFTGFTQVLGLAPHARTMTTTHRPRTPKIRQDLRRSHTSRVRRVLLVIGAASAIALAAYGSDNGTEDTAGSVASDTTSTTTVADQDQATVVKVRTPTPHRSTSSARLSRPPAYRTRRSGRERSRSTARTRKTGGLTSARSSTSTTSTTRRSRRSRASSSCDGFRTRDGPDSTSPEPSQAPGVDRSRRCRHRARVHPSLGFVETVDRMDGTGTRCLGARRRRAAVSPARRSCRAAGSRSGLPRSGLRCLGPRPGQPRSRTARSEVCGELVDTARGATMVARSERRRGALTSARSAHARSCCSARTPGGAPGSARAQLPAEGRGHDRCDVEA